MAKRRKRKKKNKRPPARVAASNPAVIAESPRGPWAWLLPWFALAFVLAATMLAYSNSFDGAFVFDDEFHIIESRQIKRPDALSAALTSSRPVVMATLALNYRWSRLDPTSYHIVNVAVHLIATCLLFGIVRRTLLTFGASSRLGRAATGIAMVSALLWALHPLQTQSVTYIIQRAESMMGMFYLLALYAVIRGAGARWPWGWYVVAILACPLGMATKAVMATAPIVILCYDRIFLAPSWRELIRRRWPLYATLVLTWGVLGMTGVIRVLDPSRHTTVGFGVIGLTWFEYARTQPEVILHYLRLAFWPSGLCLDDQWPVENRSWVIVITATAVAALLAVTLVGLVRKPKLGFLGIWFFVILAPTSTIVPIRDLSFEHRMYLSLAAVVVLAIVATHWALDRAWQRWAVSATVRRLVTVGLIVVTATALGWRTHRRNADYATPETMWAAVLDVHPEHGRAHMNFGRSLLMQGELDAAQPHLEQALVINPNHVNAHLNLGNIFYRRAEYDEALVHFERAIALSPNNADAHTNIGAIYAIKGNTEKATHHYQSAIDLDGNSSTAHYNLGLMLYKGNNIPKAMASFRRALRINPDYANAHYRLGLCLGNQKKHDEAIASYREALRCDPNHVRAKGALDAALRRGAAPGG